MECWEARKQTPYLRPACAQKRRCAQGDNTAAQSGTEPRRTNQQGDIRSNHHFNNGPRGNDGGSAVLPETFWSRHITGRGSSRVTISDTGRVRAGQHSQKSDGAEFVILVYRDICQKRWQPLPLVPFERLVGEYVIFSNHDCSVVFVCHLTPLFQPPPLSP
jgi:hypothetical protein